jgi:hypothetical protein
VWLFFYYASAPLGLDGGCGYISIMLPPRWGWMVGVVIFLLCCRPAGAGWCLSAIILIFHDFEKSTKQIRLLDFLK